MASPPKEIKTTKAILRSKEKPDSGFQGGKRSGLNQFNVSRGGRKKVKVTLPKITVRDE